MNPQFWWHLARSSGIVAWALLTASMIWGLLFTTRLLKGRPTPKWLLDLHRHPDPGFDTALDLLGGDQFAPPPQPGTDPDHRREANPVPRDSDSASPTSSLSELNERALLGVSMLQE